MLRTVVSTGAVPVTWVTPHADSQRLEAVSIIGLPVQEVGGIEFPACVVFEGAGVGDAAVEGDAASFEPQPASRRPSVRVSALPALSAAGFDEGPSA